MIVRRCALIVEAKFFDDLLCVFSAKIEFVGGERDGADDGVAAAAIAFADLGDVVRARSRRPRVGAD